MPRPCQKRRASAAANQKAKPAGPPPIRHKKRQKAIHNARRGRGGAYAGGRFSQKNQTSGDNMEQDFTSFSGSGNNFHMLNGAGSRNDPISLEGSGLEDGEVTDDSDMDSDDIDVDDLDMYEAQDMMINVEVSQPSRNKIRLARAEVMFDIPRAVAIYKEIRLAGFPLPNMTAVRFGIQELASPDSVSYPSHAPSLTSRQPSVSSSATSHGTPNETQEGLGKDYTFDFGKYSGVRFEEVPENYLRTIGGQLDVYEPKHPGLREAFDYYRPGQARTAASAPPSRRALRAKPTSQPQAQPQSQARPLLPVAPKRKKAKGPSETWAFRKGPHKGKRLVEVPENYLRTIEGMPKVVEKWPGFKAALLDFNQKTGRQSRVV
ncbi:hypothetical protein NX059_010897 [Plenodomus lindquistii]|nr:hypothetical protein NX059_010897 [Plenodomus lindquistii]